MKRRGMLKSAGIIGLSTLVSPERTFSGNNKLKIIVAGAHPDDPETGIGGTIKLLTNIGHEVYVYYLTKGQVGIKGIGPDKTAEIRIKEAKAACNVLGAKPVFGNQFDGATEVNTKCFKEVKEFVEDIKPDIVFTHWPIDTHPDHRACSNLFYNAWLNTAKGFELYYYEVNTGHQTQMFNPTDFVDITSVIDDKHRAAFLHKSQKVKEVYEDYHGNMERFRGKTVYAKYAEAFVKQAPFKADFL